MTTRTVVMLAAVAVVGAVALAARVLARLAEALDASMEATDDPPLVDDPASAGTDWTWLCGHPTAPPDRPARPRAAVDSDRWSA